MHRISAVLSQHWYGPLVGSREQVQKDDLDLLIDDILRDDFNDSYANGETPRLANAFDMENLASFSHNNSQHFTISTKFPDLVTEASCSAAVSMVEVSAALETPDTAILCRSQTQAASLETVELVDCEHFRENVHIPAHGKVAGLIGRFQDA